MQGVKTARTIEEITEELRRVRKEKELAHTVFCRCEDCIEKLLEELKGCEEK